MLKVVNNTTFV